MPPVSGSISVPSLSVIKPVFAFTVALGVDDAPVEDDALGVELEASEELEESLELPSELPEELDSVAAELTSG